MPAGKTKVEAKVGGKPTYATDFFKSDTEEQVWLGSPHIDNLVTVSLALGGENIGLNGGVDLFGWQLGEQGLVPPRVQSGQNSLVGRGVKTKRLRKTRQ